MCRFSACDHGAGAVKLAYFHAPWCGVCHVKAPVVEEISRTVGLYLERWDIEDAAGGMEAERRRIRTVPTLALLDGERVRFRLIGRMITLENARHLLAQVTS